MSQPSHNDASRAIWTARLAIISISLLLVVMLARVVQLQIAPSPRLAAAMHARASVRPEMARRGEILDRRGRPLILSRVANRVFIDPERFPKPYEDSMLRLARNVGLDPVDLAQRLMPRLAANERRHEDGLPPIRYVRVTNILDDAQAEAVRALKMPGVHLENRQVRDGPGDTLASSLLGRVNSNHAGQFGAELKFDAKLSGSDGMIRYIRDARGSPLWLDPEGYKPPTPGAPVRLSIDARLQDIVEEELERAVEDADAAGGRLVLIDPATGEVLAIADIVRDLKGRAVPWGQRPKPGGITRRTVIKPDPLRLLHPGAGRNRCFTDLHEPGSCFKPFVWALITNSGKVQLDEIFRTGSAWYTHYGRPIRDTIPRDTHTWREVLSNSSNIGMSQAVERVPFAFIRNGLTQFGFGQTTGLNIPGERSGYLVPGSKWSKYTHTSVSFGQEVGVTTAQLARAFAVFARQGELAGTLPVLRLTAANSADSKPDVLRRVIPWHVAAAARLAMVKTFEAADRRMKSRKMDVTFDYVLFGKSGTAQVAIEGERGYLPNQYISSFVGAGPLHAPQLVCVVTIDDPGPDVIRRVEHRGSAVAAPAVRRTLERSLRYLGVQPSPAPLAATNEPQ